jgi:TrmH family RNA methyltransferase
VLENPRSPRVRAVAKLTKRSAREETGLFLLEGPQAAREVLAHRPHTLVELYATPSALERHTDVRDAARDAGIEVVFTTEAVLAAMADTVTPQGIVAVARQSPTSVRDVFAASPRLVAICEEVRDPGNLGTIIRTADAAGASGIILVGETTDPFSLETVRATMGSVFAVPVARATPEEFIAWRKSAGVSVVATHLAGAVDYRTIDYRKKPVVLLMGNEQSGLPEQLAREADALARIPQQGRADSLNLAVATAVMLFEARRHLLSLAEGK